MNVGELKRKLENVPDHLDVMIYQTDDESPYNMANTAEVRSITFGTEDIPKKEWATEEVFAITDEL